MKEEKRKEMMMFYDIINQPRIYMMASNNRCESRSTGGFRPEKKQALKSFTLLRLLLLADDSLFLLLLH
jgi:hypothetical protein